MDFIRVDYQGNPHYNRTYVELKYANRGAFLNDT